MLWPSRLCADYSYDAIAPEHSWLSFAGLFVIVLVAGAVWVVRRGRLVPGQPLGPDQLHRGQRPAQVHR